MSHTYEYKRPSVTCTMFITHKDKLLLGYRQDTADTFPGELCLPGGFLIAEQDNLRQTATKETHEECKILISEDRWKLVGEYSDWPNVDPRAHIINILWHVEFSEEEFKNAEAGDDLKKIIWLNISDMINSCVPNMAFNHTKLTENWITENYQTGQERVVHVSENVKINGKVIGKVVGSHGFLF